ncbi:MAG: ATP-binding cassette domain-containing protein, partial [Ilumatobacteraceae bacterium]
MEPHEPAATRGTDAGLAAPLAAEARGVVRRFPVAGDVVTALDHVDLDVPVGRMTVVIGPSGSGKSTLLALLSCVQRPDEGTVMIGQTDVLALTLMQRERPRAPYRRRGADGRLDILVAGCGTGRHSMGIAQQFEHANVLAIDLSAASLGYAKARSGALGAMNI